MPYLTFFYNGGGWWAVAVAAMLAILVYLVRALITGKGPAWMFEDEQDPPDDDFLDW